MRCLIIGCGYVGAAVAKYWLEEGHHVTVTTRQPERVAELKQWASEVVLLSEGLSELEGVIEKVQAILLSVAPEEHSLEAYQLTYRQTAKELLYLLRQHSNPKQLVYTGSTSVYRGLVGEVHEEMQLTAPDGYVKILLETEKILQQATLHSCHVAVLRLGGICGPGREIERRLQTEKTLTGDGSEPVNLVDLEDIVQAVDFAWSKRLEGIYNLVGDNSKDGRPFTRKELYDSICNKAGLSPVQFDPNLPGRHGGKHQVSNAKIKEAGFIFSHSVLN